jgi:hypothetical protein
MRGTLLLDVPHRQVVLTIPKTLRVFFKYKKASLAAFPLRIVEDKLRCIPSKGWAEMTLKVYEVDAIVCPQCQGEMRIIAFLTDYGVVDRIINHPKLTFVADKPPPPHFAYQEFLMAAETAVEYLS